MNYFERVAATTPTRLWINNPTIEEIDLARASGAVGCTTNPAYGGGLVGREPARVERALDTCLRDGDQDERAAQLLQLRLVGEVAAAFRDAFDRSEGLNGLVSCQGSPVSDDDGEAILEEAHEACAVGPNVVPKIPATRPGLAAAEPLMRDGTTIIVTEVFSLAQLGQTLDVHERANEGRSRPSRLIISPITGIFGDHLRAVATRDGVPVAPKAIELAGVVFARRCLLSIEQRGSAALLLFGGARVTEDFTDLVGGPTASTINYSTVHDILRLDPPVSDTIHAPSPHGVEEALCRAFPDFRRALDPHGVTLDEFEGFGPVQHFRDNFLAGWQKVLDLVAARRALVAPAR